MPAVEPGELLAGLSGAEARARLARDGCNELPARERLAWWRIAASVMREPMFALLLAAAVLYGVIGDGGEAVLLMCFATLSVSIAVIQRGRSERALEALRDLSSPRALVVRDGLRARIPSREVVRGDLVVISEGDRIPADGVLISGDHVAVDESLLTGESLPVSKRMTREIPSQLGAPGGENTSQVFSGTLVVRGTGLALILATGVASAIGAIGQSLSALGGEPPRLERETRRMVIAFGVGGLVLSVTAFLLYGLLRGAWLDALLGSIALAMALLPEEFPLVLTVFMIMGAWRLSRSRVLTRRAAAIEALGAATVLCTDKTGTLTRNLMTVACLRSQAEVWNDTEPPARIAESIVLSSLLDIAVLASDDHRIDPMERSLVELKELVAGPRRTDLTLLREYPLRPELLAVARVWSEAATGGMSVAAKGAPEAIARLCALPPDAHERLTQEVDELARQGVRVLAVASARGVPGNLPAEPGGFTYQFLGIVGFTDPVRESVPAAVRECRSAGIRVVMITGDYPATAQAIARQAGLGEGELVTGAELATLDDAALAQRVRHVTVFARISPIQKLRIVSALKANGETVAMTGDGVNDAPALKAAHIGIAMGGRGTDVAREAASIVLLDDDFGSIVRAIRLGRRIYDNLRKSMGYILAIHVPIAGLALLPVLFGWPLVLTPLLIALLELIIDPACSVVFEAEREESDVMNRPPRSARSRLLSPALVTWSALQGLCAFLLVAAVFTTAVRVGMPAAQVRTLAFVTLVGANLALIFANRTFTSSLRVAFGRPNRLLWWGLGITGVVLTSLIAMPTTRQFFGFGALAPGYLGLSLAAAAVLLVLLEGAKYAWRQRLAR